MAKKSPETAIPGSPHIIVLTTWHSITRFSSIQNSQIDIGSVLKRFDVTIDERDMTVCEYGIRFVTSDGRLRTLIGRKNVKSPKQQLAKPLSDRGGVKWNLKYNGTLLLHDSLIDQPRAVKAATITHFRDHNSNTWLKVFH